MNSGGKIRNEIIIPIRQYMITCIEKLTKNRRGEYTLTLSGKMILDIAEEKQDK